MHKINQSLLYSQWLSCFFIHEVTLHQHLKSFTGFETSGFDLNLKIFEVNISTVQLNFQTKTIKLAQNFVIHKRFRTGFTKNLLIHETVLGGYDIMK